MAVGGSDGRFPLSKELTMTNEKPDRGAPGTTEERPRWEGPQENRPRGYRPAADNPAEDRDAAGEAGRDPDRRRSSDIGKPKRG